MGSLMRGVIAPVPGLGVLPVLPVPGRMDRLPGVAIRLLRELRVPG
jgi:hypothetical protein